MKIIDWFLLIELLICDVFSNENILSKLHQHTFKIKDFRVELMSYNEKYFNFFQLKTYKYNRTTPVANATFRMKISVKDKVEVVVQANKFRSNEYRHFPIRCQINLKKAFDSNAIGLRNILNCGNLTAIFFEKDVTYHVCNFFIDETQFPPLVPTGRFRLDFTLLYLNEVIGLICLFNEVYIPIPYPKDGKKGALIY